MKKVLKVFIATMVVLGVLPVTRILAQDLGDYLSDLQDMRDPFAPQLPLPKVEPPKPVVKTVPAVVMQTQQPAATGETVQPKPVASAIAVSPAPGIEVDSLVVKGVVWNTSTPQAIINDQVYKIGDKVKGMKIVSIGPKGIEISNNGVKVRINVPDKRK